MKRRLGITDMEVFTYSDCLVTAEVISRIHKSEHLCDIGAHKGHWSFVFQQLNPQLKSVVMFEPQAKLIPSIKARHLGESSKKIFQCALGDEKNQLELKGGTASASLLDVGDNQHKFFPGSTHQESELVEVKVLDELYKEAGLAYPDLIKMDVQGFELNVLKGGRAVLANARYLVIELGLRKFYDGQPPLWALFRFLEEEQYEMVDHGYELRSRTSPYELLQFDAIFKNKRFGTE